MSTLKGDCLKEIKNWCRKFASQTKDTEREIRVYSAGGGKPTSPITDEEAEVAQTRSSHPCLKMKEACLIQLEAIPISKEEGDKAFM